MQLMLERCNAHSEYSVNGGIHIYSKYQTDRISTYLNKGGKLRLDQALYMKNLCNDTEPYCVGITNHFAAYMSNAIRDAFHEECTVARLATMDKNIRRK